MPPSLLQPLLPLSLPVDMAAIPQSWRFLPLSQAELGPLFSNYSPFSYSQSLFIMPPHHPSSPASLQASFGPYSVTQVRGRKTREPAHVMPKPLSYFPVWFFTAHTRAWPPPLSPPVCLPPLRACRTRERRQRSGEVHSESSVPQVGRQQVRENLRHAACLQGDRGAQGLVCDTGEKPRGMLSTSASRSSIHPSVRFCSLLLGCVW